MCEIEITKVPVHERGAGSDQGELAIVKAIVRSHRCYRVVGAVEGRTGGDTVRLSAAKVGGRYGTLRRVEDSPQETGGGEKNVSKRTARIVEGEIRPRPAVEHEGFGDQNAIESRANLSDHVSSAGDSVRDYIAVDVRRTAAHDSSDVYLLSGSSRDS